MEVKNFEVTSGKFLARNLKRSQFLEGQSKTLKVASKFLSPMLNFQSHLRPAGRNLEPPKIWEGLCFQVLGSQGVLGGLRVLGVFVFKTPH